jgi:hypothetical protein
MNLTDTLPASSTYCLFCKRITQYNRENDDRFQALGKLMYCLIKLFKKYDYGAYRTLKSVFEQQFTLTPEKTILPREKEKISAQSIQSPHDPDCHYRNKGGNKV